MKLYEIFNDGGFHTTIITTFGVEFDAFESIVLNRLRGADCRNVVLIADAGMLGLTLAEPDSGPRAAGTNYIVAKARAKGVFHPKVILQLGRSRGRLIVMSANATASGLAGNLEISAILECGTVASGEQQLIFTGWNYVTRFLDGRQQAVADKIDWARRRTPWLVPDKAADGLVPLADGTQAAFLTNNGATSIGSRFLTLAGTRKSAERLIVLSPYWDDGLAALEALRDSLRPRETFLLVDTERGLFPTKAVPKRSKIQIQEIQGFDKKLFPADNKRFVHAKMIIATIGGVDHVLAGSPNCTLAALGGEKRSATNEEACLYRRLPAGKVLAELGLASILDKEHAVDLRQIPAPIEHDSLPLEEAVNNDPGTFEMAFEKIFWWPPSNSLMAAVERGKATLELLNVRGKPLAAKIDLSPPTDRADRNFQVGGLQERPAFARFRRANGSPTGMAIVASIDELRAQTRDPLTARADRAIRELADDDTEESLWLLETIQALAQPQAGSTPSAPPRGPRTNDTRKDEAAPVRLDFDTFMRGRQRRFISSKGEQNWLAGSHVSLVRAFLNRALGLATGGTPSSGPEDDASDVVSALDTGDEVANAEQALEKGLDLQKPGLSANTAAKSSRKRSYADALAIGDAVDAFAEDLREGNRSLEALDMLRLRAILTIIAVAAQAAPTTLSAQFSSVQVLPVFSHSHDQTWPRLMGRVLQPVFRGPHPAIKRFVFDKSHDRFTDDVLETWACCAWSIQATLAATRTNAECAALVPFLVRLADSLRALLPLSEDELAAPAFSETVEALDRRFGPRLQISSLKGACMKFFESRIAEERAVQKNEFVLK